jgi:hypothetical protein
LKTPSYTRRANDRYHAKNRARVDLIKAHMACEDCGGPAEHFHHRDPTTRLFSIARTKSWGGMTILREIEKCDLLCAECHRARHTPPQKIFAS